MIFVCSSNPILGSVKQGLKLILSTYIINTFLYHKRNIVELQIPLGRFLLFHQAISSFIIWDLIERIDGY